MSFEGFLRFAWIPLLELGVSILIIWLMAKQILKQTMSDKVKSGIKTARFAIILLAVVIVATWLVMSAGLNIFPRSDLDRRDLNQQNQQWEQKQSK